MSIVSPKNKGYALVVSKNMMQKYLKSYEFYICYKLLKQQINSSGFIFINCTLSDGTHITKWVLATKNTLCIKPTMGPIKVSDTPLGKESIL